MFEDIAPFVAPLKVQNTSSSDRVSHWPEVVWAICKNYVDFQLVKLIPLFRY